jgi:hypothetical protein
MAVDTPQADPPHTKSTTINLLAGGPPRSSNGQPEQKLHSMPSAAGPHESLAFALQVNYDRVLNSFTDIRNIE